MLGFGGPGEVRLTAENDAEQALRERYFELIASYTEPGAVRNATGPLLSAVTALNKETCQPGTRLEILEAVTKAYSPQLALERVLFDASLGAWRDPVTELLRELVYGYNRVVNALWDEQTRSEMPRVVERLIRLLGLLVLNRFDSYRIPSDRLFYGMHRFYGLAEHFELEDALVPALGITTGADQAASAPAGAFEHSPSRAYKQILLTALADPYHFLPGQAWQLYRFLGQRLTWLDECELAMSPRQVEPSPFVLDLADAVVDDAKLPLIGEEKYMVAEQNRLVSLQAFGAHIDEEIDRLNGDDNRILSLTERLEQVALGNLLRRAQAAWQRRLYRRYPRRPLVGEIALIVGFDAIHRYRGEQVEPAPIPTKANVTGALLCETVDESDGGFSLAVHLDEPTLSVGQPVLGTLGPAEKDRRWLIGMVRWLQRVSQSRYRFGIQTLGSFVHAARLWPAGAHRMAEAVNALLVFENELALEGLAIVDYGRFKVGDRAVAGFDGLNPELEFLASTEVAQSREILAFKVVSG